MEGHIFFRYFKRNNMLQQTEDRSGAETPAAFQQGSHEGDLLQGEGVPPSEGHIISLVFSKYVIYVNM